MRDLQPPERGFELAERDRGLAERDPELRITVPPQPKTEPGEPVTPYSRMQLASRLGRAGEHPLNAELVDQGAEIVTPDAVGDREPFGVRVDNTGRFIGTMRIREMFQAPRDFEPDEWVEGEAWRKEPGVGVFVIVERAYLALLPEHEPHALTRGAAASFRVTHMHRDGKLELSLRGLAHEELEDDAQRVLEKLIALGQTAVSEKAHPDQVRALFGLSRKAFKRAIGRLLREGRVELDEQRFIVPVTRPR